MIPEQYVPKIALSVQAHPDDQDFTVAGTLAKWAQTGCRVISLIVTSGEAGSNDPIHTVNYKKELAHLREIEQTQANQILGIEDTVFLRFPDGELEPSMSLRKAITRIIRKYKPDVVVTGNPQGVFYGSGYINHPDHRAAAESAVYAVFPSAGTRLIFTDLLDEGYEPHNVTYLYIHGVEKPDTWIDISISIDLKITALSKHASQLGNWDPEQMIRKWAAEEGQGQGMEYAEAYKVMDLSENNSDL